MVHHDISNSTAYSSRHLIHYTQTQTAGALQNSVTTWHVLTHLFFLSLKLITAIDLFAADRGSITRQDLADYLSCSTYFACSWTFLRSIFTATSIDRLPVLFTRKSSPRNSVILMASHRCT